MRFIVETTDELPVILLIAVGGEVRDLLTRYLGEKHFQVEVVDPSQAPQILQQRKTPWERIIWWAGPLYFTEVIHQEISGALLQRLEPKVILGTVLPPVLGNNELLRQWNTAVEAQEEWASFLAQIPNARLLCGQNVVASGVPSPEGTPQPFPLFSVLLTESKKGPYYVVPESTQDLGMQTLTSFLSHALSALMRPASQPELFIPKERKERRWFSEYVHVMRRVAPEIPFQVLADSHLTSSVPWKPVSVAGQDVTYEIEQYGLWLSGVVHRLLRPVRDAVSETANFFTTEQTMVLPTATDIDGVVEDFSRKHHVVPIIPPMIENRQKKYEQRNQDLKRRKRAVKQFSLQQQRQILIPPTPVVGVQRGKPDHSLDKEIQKIFGNQRTIQKNKRINVKAQKTIGFQKKFQRQTVVVSVVTVLITLAVLFGSTFGLFLLSQHMVVQAMSSVMNNTTASFSERRAAIQNLHHWTSALSIQTDGYKVFLGRDSLPFSAQLTSMGKELEDSLLLADQVRQEREQVSQILIGKDQGDVFQKILDISGKTQELYKKLSLLQSQIQGVDETQLGEEKSEQLKNFSTQLQEQRRILATYQQLEQALPTILAQAQRKTYLLLLQNTQELRPTGGFLQSSALVTVENGVIINHQVVDVKKIDESLNGQVEAPAELTRMLGQKNLYLRDANWSPHFPETALQASRFLEKSMGRQVDGVIALNTLTLRQLIRQLGPLSLAKHNEVITDKNLMEKLEFHSEIQVNQGEEEYSSAVLAQAFEQFINTPPEKMQGVIDTFYQGLKNGEVFVVVNQPTANETLENLGWTGSVVTPACPAQFSDVACQVDTMMQVEANIGINKANHYVKRSVEHSITLQPDKVIHERTVTVNNTAPTNAWPAGPYRSYFRFYVPPTAQLESISVDDVAVADGEILSGEAHQKKYFGLRVEVPIQQEQVIRVKYSVPLEQQKPFSYAFFNQRQAGIGETPLVILLSVDLSLRPTVVAPQAEINGNTLRFVADQEKHSFVGVKIE